MKSLKNLLPTRPRTLVLGIVMLVAFVGMASIFAPAPLRASLGIGDGDETPSEAFSASATDELQPLGQLEAAGYKVEIYSSKYGPRYSVYDEHGRRLAELASASEVSARFPELDITGATADVPIRVMGTDVGGGGGW